MKLKQIKLKKFGFGFGFSFKIKTYLFSCLRINNIFNDSIRNFTFIIRDTNVDVGSAFGEHWTSMNIEHCTL